MKRIAIVTGASSGMGQRFAITAANHVEYDELWLIARRGDRLMNMAEKELNGQKVRCFPLDLSLSSSFTTIKDALKEEPCQVVLLVNAAGFGKFQAIMDVSEEMAERMLDLNCKAVMKMCYACIPYMTRGAKILNIASVAAFQPVPYIGEYAATKAFVLSFSRALWKELRGSGITVTALCPYWTRTEFFDVANGREGKDMVKYFNAMYEPDQLVKRGWRDLANGRDISTFGFIARAQLFLITLLPHRWVMAIWCKQQNIKQ
ncbi:MAG: SDR family NAD(P)-dependent oxidoreductase [Paludibacteraceae bacterium]|nr:SDR family NAD(P)-dependent oxidoreductase [Paludibacteraceae bacterium]